MGYMDSTFLSRLVAKEDGDPDDAQALFEHLTKHNYDPKVVEWVKGARVHKANVPVSRIQYNGKPEDPEKVRRMVRQLKSGEELPRILLADTGSGKLRIADGHHRAFASRDAQLTTARAYVLTHVGDSPKEPWRIMHDQQRAQKPQETPAEKASEGKVSKVSVHYRVAGNNARRCGTCDMYSNGTCTLVAGSIDPGHVCDRWESREKAQSDETQSTTNRPQMTPVGSPPFNTGDPTKPAERYPTANITLKPSGKQLRVRVADTPALRKVGLQNTPDMGTDFDGMLFKWPGDTQATLHNHGVDFPVSAVFFDSSGMYRDHFHMLPNDGTPKSPKASHRYALEVHSRDWDSLGLGPGAAISEASEKDQSRNGSVQMGDETTPGMIK